MYVPFRDTLETRKKKKMFINRFYSECVAYEDRPVKSHNRYRNSL